MQGGPSSHHYHKRQRSKSESRSSNASYGTPSTHHNRSSWDDRRPKENSYDNRRSYPLHKHHSDSRDYRHHSSNGGSSQRMNHSTSSQGHRRPRIRMNKMPSEQVIVHTAPLSSNKILQLAKQSLSKSNSLRLERPAEPRDSTSSSPSSSASTEIHSESKGVKRPQTDEINASPPKLAKPSENVCPHPKIEIKKDLLHGLQKKKSRLSLMKNTARAEKEILQQDGEATTNGSSSHVVEKKANKGDKKKSSTEDSKEKKKKDKHKNSEKEKCSNSDEELDSSEELEVITQVSSKVIPAVIVTNKAERNSRESSPELEIIAESLICRRPVLNYGNPVASAPEKYQNPVPSSSVPETVAAPPLGYSWPIKSKPVVQTASASSARPIDFTSCKTSEEKPAAETSSASSTPSKITGYFSPSKKSSAKSSVGSDETSTTVTYKVASSPRTSSAKKEAAEMERKSTFLNLTAFKKILINVMNIDKFKPLINQQDHEIIFNFIKLPEESKALLVHLASVKLQWRRISSMKYPELNMDLNIALNPLIEDKFVVAENELTDLREMLDLFKVNEMKELSKTYKLKSTKKSQTIDELIKLGQRQSCLMGNLTDKITKDVKKILGRCIKVNSTIADVLHRMCILDTLAICFNDSSLSEILFRANQVHFNQICFPEYTISMKTDIFMDRDYFIKFHQAYMLRKELEKSLEAKNWEACALSTKEAWAQFKELISENSFQATRDHDKNLPEYLQKFSAGYTLARIMTSGLDPLGKRKEYDTSVHMLNDLLAQRIYCKRHRGSWYDRLSLILHKHIKILGGAAEAVFKGIDDMEVQLVYKLSLANRASMLQKSKLVSSLEQSMREKLIICSQGQDLTAALEISLEGKVKSRTPGAPGQKLNFIIEGVGPEETTYIGSVEECAIAHYKRLEGFQMGRHNEGGTIVFLFGLLFWDEIYKVNVPDAFISDHQTQPLDLYGYDFYKNRKKQLEEKFQLMQHWTKEQSREYFTSKFTETLGVNSILPSFAFQSAEEVHSLYMCMGPDAVTKICLKLLKDYRNSRAGFPDLVVWSPGVENKYKFIEVKSPNDVLSDKQKVWIDFLRKSDIPVELCRVGCVAAKFLDKLSGKTPASADSASGPST